MHVVTLTRELPPRHRLPLTCDYDDQARLERRFIIWNPDDCCDALSIRKTDGLTREPKKGSSPVGLGTARRVRRSDASETCCPPPRRAPIRSRSPTEGRRVSENISTTKRFIRNRVFASEKYYYTRKIFRPAASFRPGGIHAETYFSRKSFCPKTLILSEIVWAERISSKTYIFSRKCFVVRNGFHINHTVAEIISSKTRSAVFDLNAFRCERTLLGLTRYFRLKYFSN